MMIWSSPWFFMIPNRVVLNLRVHWRLQRLVRSAGDVAGEKLSTDVENETKTTFCWTKHDKAAFHTLQRTLRFQSVHPMRLALSSGSQVDSITDPFYTLNLNRKKAWWSVCLRRGHSHRKIHRVSQLWSCLQSWTLLWAANTFKKCSWISQIWFVSTNGCQKTGMPKMQPTKTWDVISWLLFTHLATGFCGTSELGLHAVALKCLLYRITLAPTVKHLTAWSKDFPIMTKPLLMCTL